MYRKEIFILLDFEGPVDRIRTSTVRALRPGYRHVSTMMFCLSGKSSRCVWGDPYPPRRRSLLSDAGASEKRKRGKQKRRWLVRVCVCVCAAVSERASGRCGGMWVSPRARLSLTLTRHSVHSHTGLRRVTTTPDYSDYEPAPAV